MFDRYLIFHLICQETNEKIQPYLKLQLISGAGNRSTEEGHRRSIKFSGGKWRKWRY